MEKKKVYFNEYNVLMENTVYLPLVSGLLQSYAKKDLDVESYYEFMPFIFFRDELDNITEKYDNPSVAVFSVSMWNFNLSIAVATKVKEKYPDCLIIFGGPHVPFVAEEFFKKYPFIDLTVRGEGEQTFQEVLKRFISSRDFKDIPGISYRGENGECIKNNEERALIENLDIVPSPYLNGTFDYLLKEGKINFQTIIETNRGCPYNCAYCFWGYAGLNKRFRFYSLERVKEVIDWCGKNKIIYVFCADSNFGMFKRDYEICEYMVETKKKYGYPEKLRVCYAKNTEENIYKVGKLLHMNSLEKGITLSRQTNSVEALINVNRKNINMEVFNSLQKRFNEEDIPVYTELILGLPGESYKSFSEGIDEILEAGYRNQLLVYHCQVFPNTLLSDKEYQNKHGIVARSIPLNEVHALERPAGLITELEDVIVTTKTMPKDDWERSTVLSWTTQLLQGLRLGFYLLEYVSKNYDIKYTEFLKFIISSNDTVVLDKEIKRFARSASLIYEGKPYRQILPEFSPIYWEQDESSYLNISENIVEFFNEMFILTKKFLDAKGKCFDEDELKEVIEYQKARVPNYRPLVKKEFKFDYNIPEYFENIFQGKKIDIIKKPQTIVLDDPKDFNGSKKDFAIEIILRGKRNNKTIQKIKIVE